VPHQRISFDKGTFSIAVGIILLLLIVLGLAYLLILMNPPAPPIATGPAAPPTAPTGLIFPPPTPNAPTAPTVVRPNRVAPTPPVVDPIPDPAIVPAPGVVETPTPAAVDANVDTNAAPVTPVAPVPPAQKVEPVTPRPAFAALAPVASKPSTAQPIKEGDIEASMRRGVDYLYAQFENNKLTKEHTGQHDDGMHALATLSLIYASKSLDDKRLALQGSFMRGLLQELKAKPMEDNMATYGRGLRLSALGLANRIEDRPAMANDLRWLLQSTYKGGFTYGKPAEGATPSGDNSNSQYGTLGVWAAAEAGFNVSTTFWNDVQNYWLSRLTEEGGWGYTSSTDTATPPMTAAGLTSLSIALQYGNPAGGGKALVARNQAVRNAVEWFGEGRRLEQAFSDAYPGYTLYGIERAGLASGYRFMGDRDWFLALAPQVIARQDEKGAWPGTIGPVGETAFNLLFLSRGSFPILMTKLQFDGDWNTRPNDLTHLARFASGNLERSFNWQIVPVASSWENWTGSPVAFLASDAAPNIDDTSGLQEIRGFINHGNLLFTHADKGSRPFSEWVEATAAKLFPDYPMQDVPADHPIYSVAAILKDRPPLRMVTNGSRVLWLHSPTDVASRWERRNEKSDPDGFGFGINVSVFATGLAPFRDRLQTYVEPGKPFPKPRSFPIARLTYDGSWNPEPAAWENFGRWLGETADVGIYTIDTTADKLNAFEQPVAHLTGTSTYTPTADTVAAIRKYVTEGGTLLIDSTGGSETFAVSAISAISEITAGIPAALLKGSHPLLALPEPWPTVGELETRASIGGRPDGVETAPQVYAVGKGHIIYADRDLTTGLLGSNVWNLRGYTPNWSRAMMRNLIVGMIEQAKSRPRAP